MKRPESGEIWIVNFEPQVGYEIKKKRPALVVSLNTYHLNSIRVVIPLRSNIPQWNILFHPIQANKENGLHVPSFADVSQLRCVSLERFKGHLGFLQDQHVGIVREIIKRYLCVH